MKRTPLSRGKGLRRTKALEPNAPPTGEPRPKKRSATSKGRAASGDNPYEGESKARKIVRERSRGECELKIPGVCLGRASNFHHRQNRGRGKVGKWLASNGLDVCGSGTTGCHGAVTNTNGNRAEYERLGWIVPSWADPHEVTAVIWPVGRVLLHDDGEYTSFLPDELPFDGHGTSMTPKNARKDQAA